MALAIWIEIIGGICVVFWGVWRLADKIDKEERQQIEQEVRAEQERELQEQWQRQQYEQWQQQQWFYGQQPQYQQQYQYGPPPYPPQWR